MSRIKEKNIKYKMRIDFVLALFIIILLLAFLLSSCGVFEIDLFGKHKPKVAVEVLSSEQEDPWATVLYCKKILLDAWTHINELGIQ